MKGRHWNIIIVVALFVGAAPLSARQKSQMRAAWIATVANIDWPARGVYDVEEQQRSMVAMLDSLQALNFNTIIFQVRPTSDAFYLSDLEPWSRFLTGQQGIAPDPFYDPLAFVIYEAHRRQIDVHVWINPYRVLTVDNPRLLSYNHPYFRYPELMLRYGSQYYFNPGLYQTRQHLIDVVCDIVRRYDVDGVHMDDYFYPYPIAGVVFPDKETFEQHPRGYSNIEDWRRNNVNLIIEELSHMIKKTKPWVEFGISPFGVWRNNNVDPSGSATRAGITNYDNLYADIALWMRQGWIDYVVPQLYWEIGFPPADYAVLLRWWAALPFKGNVYIGHTSSKVGTETSRGWRTPNELCRQLKMNESEERIGGSMFFSAKTLLENRQGLCDSLRSDYFQMPALVPANANIGGDASDAPQNLRVESMGRRDYLMWDEVYDGGGYCVKFYIVYAIPEGMPIGTDNPRFIVAYASDNLLEMSQLPHMDAGRYNVVVTSYNRFHRESPASNVVQIDR